jgi:class 3 adenylate cyclase
VILGLGKILAERIGGDLTVLALWDGQPGDAVGGTHSMVEYSRAKGIKVVTLNPLKPREKTLSSSTAQSVQAGSHRPLPGAEADPPQQIGYLLFADAVKFSKVTERQLPLLLERYLSRIAQLLRQYEHAVAATNTWGDGLYVVFSSPREAGLFALDLRDFVASGQWRQAGLPATFKLRVALHAGPVYRFHDPILGRANFIGSHVNFAARMEPATPPGQIYCSQAFAALAVAEGVREFQWEYVGEVELAKGAGAAAAYLLQRAKAGESPSHEQPA